MAGVNDVSESGGEAANVASGELKSLFITVKSQMIAANCYPEGVVDVGFKSEVIVAYFRRLRVKRVFVSSILGLVWAVFFHGIQREVARYSETVLAINKGEGRVRDIISGAYSRSEAQVVSATYAYVSVLLVVVFTLLVLLWGWLERRDAMRLAILGSVPK